jgi:hypothetical protein
MLMRVSVATNGEPTGSIWRAFWSQAFESELPDDPVGRLKNVSRSGRIDAAGSPNRSSAPRSNLAASASISLHSGCARLPPRTIARWATYSSPSARFHDIGC